MSVVTRFAPSPTGFLHIGGARTALFNWLFARHHGGRYLLRIEDTDRARSTEAAIQAILDGLGWLGLVGDELPVFQSQRSERHAEVAQGAARARRRLPLLLHAGRAAGDARAGARRRPLDRLRRALARPRPGRGASRHRRRRSGSRRRARARPSCPTGSRATVRFDNAQLDDMVLLRADGTPTYMLSVVVDDHDMGVTHVIRGDDHLVNAARQTQIYRALDWPVPVFAHIPLIHGRRRRQAVEAPRRARRRRLSRDGLPAGGAAQLPAAARLEPRRRTRSSAPSRRSPGSISTRSAGAPRASTWRG